MLALLIGRLSYSTGRFGVSCWEGSWLVIDLHISVLFETSDNAVTDIMRSSGMWDRGKEGQWTGAERMLKHSSEVVVRSI